MFLLSLIYYYFTFLGFQGLGTNDDVLIRVIVSRSEVDLVEIKHEFQQTYGQTLEAFIAVKWIIVQFAGRWMGGGKSHHWWQTLRG